MGIVNCQNFARARRIIGARLERALQGNGSRERNGAGVSVKMLKKDISELTKVKGSFVREAESKENCLLPLLTAINVLWRDEVFVRLATEEHLFLWCNGSLLPLHSVRWSPPCPVSV